MSGCWQPSRPLFLENRKMDIEEIRKRYDEIRVSVPDDSGRRHWFSRLMSWEDFQEFGPETASWIWGHDPDGLRNTWPEMAELLKGAFLNPGG